MNRTSASFADVAGNGLLDRRLLLKGLLGTGILVASTRAMGNDQPDWMQKPGRRAKLYGMPAAGELERTGRVALPPQLNASAPLRSLHFTPLDKLRGTITPAGLHFELSHQGIPNIDPDQHKLVLHGLVNRPLYFSLDSLERYSMSTHCHFLECSGNTTTGWQDPAPDHPLAFSHGLLSASEWVGVPLATLLDEASVLPEAKWIIAEGADSGSLSRSIPLQKALQDCMIVLYQNGERLRPEQGYPMRLLNPGFEGNSNVKWLRSLKVTDTPAMTRFETSRYTDLLADGKARQFSLKMDVKSVITHPNNSQQLQQKGVYEISGLAWSGSGRIRKVEVTADGGKSWAKALLDEPVQSRMLTRFRLPWRWVGQPAVLASRAEDEHGNRQPTRDALVAARGTNSFYHYNGIHGWGVSASGEVNQADV